MTTTTLDRLAEGYRSLPSTVHDIDDRKHQIAIDFPADGPPDTYRTTFGARCFDESFRREPTMPFLVEHDRKSVIGHTIRAESLPLSHRVVSQFSDFDDVPLARRYFAHLRDGDLGPGPFSFHFTDAKSEPHPSIHSARRFTKARMREVSVTTAASIPGVTMSGLRSAAAVLPNAVERIANGLSPYAPGSSADIAWQFELRAMDDELVANAHAIAGDARELAARIRSGSRRSAPSRAVEIARSQRRDRMIASALATIGRHDRRAHR